MQCPSCQFENMPGSRNCARCGGMLALAAAAINVHPPRANRISRAMPRVWGRYWSMRREFDRYRGRAAVPFRELFERFDDTDFSLDVMLACVVPGLAHRLRGNRYRGRMFMLAYLGLLIPGVLLLGTSIGSILLGLAFATHVASASDALVGRFATAGDRLMFTFTCAMALGLAVYLPIGGTTSRFAIPIRINQPVYPFAQGDVLWYNPSAVIEPGDYVLYAVTEMSIRGVNDHTRYDFGNQWINRVAAIGGQQVRVKEGKLSIDNVASLWQPLAPSVQGIEVEFVVPAGELFIPPESLTTTGARVTGGDWQRLSLVPRSRVAGRIFFRSQPWSRISSIQGIENEIE